MLGPDAAALARQIETLPGNRTAFVVTGGFEAWRSGGLKVRVSHLTHTAFAIAHTRPAKGALRPEETIPTTVYS